ncbi:pilus modification protein PilQ [Synechococcus sp. 63AY4M2]|jgi:type IV pilus assembly protein PilQ|nr:pilus modification protein PilQ [Synechococcus sp. 63AY4M2]PIK88704.1 pilus modification protein PilQ [Synechococcus sp. 65AY6A5]PIK94496.1 pilus modification protein PilQ [Synechococcus sp. 60AY4M2]PIK96753.1 pilus modification protein PilQ [Synechococcus sp. 63AY4M1]
MMNRRVAWGCALSLILSLPLLAVESQLDEAAAQQLTSANPQSLSRITDIRLVPHGNRMKLEINTAGGARPQVFFTQQGQSWIGDITNAQLDGGQGRYRQESPLPGVRFIEAKQMGNDSVRIEIAGVAAAPQGLLAQRSPTQLVFEFEGLPSALPAPVAAAPSQEVVPNQPASPTRAQPGAPPATPASSPAAQNSPSPRVAAATPQPLAQNSPSSPPAQTAPTPQPASPRPVISQVPSVGQLNQPQLPPGSLPTGSPFQGRAVAPPAGDIAVGTILPDPPTVDLGSNARISLTLKDAPVGDVLSLLVRRAGLNVVLNDVPPDLTISLDVQDSPLQETFNFILRLKQLQAQRRGQTVFVGQNLPGVTEILVRNYRVNQAVATDLASRLEEVLNAVAPGAQFVVDERTNSITVIGNSRQQDIAAAQIAQLDVRRRQVLISLRAVDIRLNKNESLSVNLGGASGNFALGTLGDANFGGQPLNQPAGSSVSSIGPAGPSGSITGIFNTLNRLQQSLALRVQSAIQNGTGKILTDPKVVVADGGSSRISIATSVPVNVETITIPQGENQPPVVTQRLQREDAGVILDVSEVRIDDNGFVTLTIQPEISIPVPIQVLEGGDFAGIQLFNIDRRRLEASQLRLRDGQTFIIAGLIQDRDTVDVQKVPFLGDLPLLGALFRSQSVNNERNEVVFMLTPYIMDDNVAFGLPPNP